MKTKSFETNEREKKWKKNARQRNLIEIDYVRIGFDINI